MSEQQRPDDLAQLRALVEGQQHELARHRAELARLRRRPRHRLTARLGAALAVALLVAALPLGLLAAGPFTDLNQGRDHAAANADIQAIADAGITRGCNPPDYTAYCPNDYVTREQMASFIARTAGLGSNRPVTNAAALNGLPASAYLGATGDTKFTYTFFGLNTADVVTVRRTGGPEVKLSVPPRVSETFSMWVPLDRPSVAFGKNLAIASAEVCYRAEGGATITKSELWHGNQVQEQLIVSEQTVRNSPTNTCYTFSPASPATVDGAVYLQLIYTLRQPTEALYLYSITLTMRPT